MRQGQLSERGGAATAGQVLAQSNTSQQNVTDAQIKQTETLDKLVATEDARLSDERRTLQLAQAEGAGIASAQAQNASNASIQQGVTALANLGMQAYGNSELYNQNGGLTNNNNNNNNQVSDWSSPGITSNNQVTTTGSVNAQGIEVDMFGNPLNRH